MFTHLLRPADDPDPSVPDAVTRFRRHVAQALDASAPCKLVLANYRGDEPDLQRLLVRPVQLRGDSALSFVYRYRTRDITKNHARAEGLAEIGRLLGSAFMNAHLHSGTQEVQLAFSRRGHASLRIGSALPGPADGAAQPLSHNRQKTRPLALTQPWWCDLGLATPQHALVPAMARKWKQVNKFVEIFAAALAASPLAQARGEVPLRVADLGAGKAYLTFAVHEYLSGLGRACDVVGVELRDDLVRLCNATAQRHGLAGLHFEQGDVGSWTSAGLDVLIALHACDTATDHAMHLGVRAGAGIIMCAPCCHKELRPQMGMPPLLRPMLQHGVHLGQQAEMVTDSLRALLLDAAGYDTQVFEFVALEHTQKNKMVLAVRRAGGTPPERAAELQRQIAEIKAFYGIGRQRLEMLMSGMPDKETVPA